MFHSLFCYSLTCMQFVVLNRMGKGDNKRSLIGCYEFVYSGHRVLTKEVVLYNLLGINSMGHRVSCAHVEIARLPAHNLEPLSMTNTAQLSLL